MNFSLTTESANFNKHIADFKKKSNLSESTILRKFAFDLIKRIVEKSPVDTGRSRAGWYVAMEKLGGVFAFGSQPGPNGKSPSDLSEVKLGQSSGSFSQDLSGSEKWIEIVNGVNYVIYLEYGYSRQAPYGMIRISMREMAGKKLPQTMGIKLQKDWNSFYS